MISDEYSQFVRMSRFAGSRFDLSQAGGGNTSVKLPNGRMIIKSSGYYLGDVTESKGHCEVDLEKLKAHLENFKDKDNLGRDQINETMNAILKKSTFTSGNRPSIETFLHLLFKKYTLHIHPIAINAFLFSANWKNELRKDFPDALYVPYATPGGELALRVYKEYKTASGSGTEIPDIVFLQNHGVIFTADTAGEVLRITEDVTNICEKRLGLNVEPFRKCTVIANALESLTGELKIVNLSEDTFLRRVIHEADSQALCPDDVVYWGGAVLMSKGDIVKETADFFRSRKTLPKIVVDPQSNIYFIADSLFKCRGIEDQFKAHMMSKLHCQSPLVYLNHEEIDYLINWEAEKFRQTVS